MATCRHIFTLGDYLKGKVRGITLPDDALMSICADVQLQPDVPIANVSERDRELSLAWLYMWVALGPTQTATVKDEDADWSHSEGGERMSANALKRYLDMANEIFDKYDLPTVGAVEKWGLVDHGFCNPRRLR